MEQNAKLGLRSKALQAPEGKIAGYIEYLPGEYAWRGVDAAGYMFIHCIWIHGKAHQGRGWGRQAVLECIEDARASGMRGVAVMSRKKAWLAGRALFVKCGFEVADRAAPDYELLVLRFSESSQLPSFKGGWEGKAGRFKRGLTIVKSAQCPYIEKFASEIAEAAADYGLKPRIVELKSYRDAQEAPTAYAVFSVILDGKVLADHQISRTRFHNLMKVNASTR